MKKEIWKSVKGFEGFYEASNLGRVKSIKRTSIDSIGRKRIFRERILKQFSRQGYLRVSIYSNTIFKSARVSRIVAEAFILNPENKPQINHINGIKIDNSIENLEWATAKENVNHAYKTGLKIGRRGEKCNLSKLKNRDVYAILKSNKPQKELSKKHKVSISLISQIKNKIIWKHL